MATFTWSGSRWIYRRPSLTPIGNANGIGVGYDQPLRRVLAIETYQPGVCMPHSGCTEPARTIATTWDGNGWRATDLGAPSSRAELLDPTTFTYDPAGHGMLALDTHGNTWRLTNQHWVLVATAQRSPHRQFMAIASDPAHHQVIAFGGYPPINKIPTSMPGDNDTWIWNGKTWQQHAAPATAPFPPDAPTPQTCGLNGPALVPGEPQYDGTSIRLTFSDLFVVAPCHLTVSVRLVVVNAAGHPLAVTGNPATATFNADVSGTFSSVLEGGMTWTNPCAAPGGAQVQIYETGRGALPGPLTIALPAATCAHPTPSTLSADPLTVSAPATS